LLIPGTSSTKHLRENLSAAALGLPSHAIAELNAIAGSVPPAQKAAHRLETGNAY
jgi:aryl-alcohol dehydrogenase-like predicted oxidoreductase